MDDGFQVDLLALTRAADGITGVLDDVTSRPLTSPDVETGHGELAQALVSFTNAWREGVGTLTADGRELAAGLSATSEAYQRVEAASLPAFDGVLGAPRGPDPGLR